MCETMDVKVKLLFFWVSFLQINLSVQFLLKVAYSGDLLRGIGTLSGEETLQFSFYLLLTLLHSEWSFGHSECNRVKKSAIGLNLGSVLKAKKMFLWEQILAINSGPSLKEWSFGHSECNRVKRSAIGLNLCSVLKAKKVVPVGAKQWTLF